uniref:Uncharacterized protein n=1 Tax=Anguilla anguilla TaxID=7936 RepID=A0A0E9Q796_ANGAN
MFIMDIHNEYNNELWFIIEDLMGLTKVLISSQELSCYKHKFNLQWMLL